ncbi:MAG: DNA recombination protein RmuC [Arenimonas sp.]|nr:DNA recombination protein RmuC [Arenimonas sp.]MBP6627488.1 DNA recombination protein RmuC [Arenimonas sp.]
MDFLAILLFVMLAAIVLLLVLLLRRNPAGRLAEELETRLGALRQDLDRIERGLRDEHRSGRGEQQAALSGFDARLGQFTERTETGLQSLRQNLGDDARRSREESALGLQRFGEGVQARLEKLTETNERRLGEVRLTLEAKLKDIQQDNAAKLEQVRQTVDEKLQATLETRLGESFRQVSERLEQVHRGLGEMQTLATGVGDLKRVLGNVKTRGIFGEVQLGAILDQVMTAEQYSANVATRPNSAERVEFAVRLPGAAGDPTSQVWLPIDAKFPREDYERLLDAQERADAEAAALAGQALERRIRDEGKAIAQKYVEPPHTTDFALLFLPTEGLYAEVLRRPGLVEAMQREHRIVIAGPTTLSALLNSLRMGFRTLAIEQRSSEVWQVLGAVRTEFGKFAGVLEKTRKKLTEASNSIESAHTRTRVIERKLRNVEASTAEESRRLLGELGDGLDSDGAADLAPGEAGAEDSGVDDSAGP